VLTSGTSEGYAHLFRLLADPGDAILAPRPSYPLFEPLAAAEGVTLRPYALRWDGAWHVDLASVDEALGAGRARALLLVQPHHPTGACVDPATLAALESACEAHGAALVSDEVFGDFPWPTATALPSLLTGVRRVPAFVLSGLSKVCGMPQLKLGWIALAGPPAARAQARAGLEWLADLFLSVNGPVQGALPRLLESGVAYRTRVRERIGANLGTLAAFLAAHPDVDLRSAPAGWVALLRLPMRPHAPDWALALLERGVAVHPGHFYDLDDDAHVVASLIVAPETFAAALGRVGEALDRG
jgi:alanine-synthesizing transaminase